MRTFLSGPRRRSALRLRRGGPAGRREAALAGLLAAGYAAYLFACGYHLLYFDAGMYWELGHRFYAHGRFEPLAYDDALRGYAYPLVNFCCLGVRKALHWQAVTVVKLVNAALAGGLFGVVGPRLWRATTGAAALPSVGRRLAWAALGFAFWRDYFNFSLTDFPAVAALGLALGWAPRPGWRAVLLAGAALAFACNARPVYQIAAPAVAGLLLLGWPRAAWGPRLAAFGLGAALVLAPQWLINRRHFGANTPLVLAQSPALGIHDLYLEKLWAGLTQQKYESSVGPDLPSGQLLFLNPAGAAMLRAEHVTQFASAGQYLRVAARHPGTVLAAYATHLFAGLDVSHPTPYLIRWAPPAGLRWLNYALWFGAGLVVLAAPRRPTAREGLVLAALLLPCLAVLPLGMEVRYLLPLHLLVLAVAAFGRWPVRVLKERRWLVATGLAYVVFTAACLAFSDRILHAVEPRYRAYVLPPGAALLPPAPRPAGR